LRYSDKKLDNSRNLAHSGVQTRSEIPGWREQRTAMDVIEQVNADTLAIRIAAWKTLVVDLREVSAFRCIRIPEAIQISLPDLRASVQGLPLETSVSLVCETGEKCPAAASILWNLGYRKIAVLTGGFATYVNRGLPVTTIAAPP
jgi:rhodanese-related sulfurtransferase